MNKKYQVLVSFVSFFSCITFCNQINAQAFKKGSLLVSITEGWTTANYTTRDINSPVPTTLAEGEVGGIRDPLIIEYGLTNKFGIGLSSGTDVFKVNPSRFYNFRIPGNEAAEVKTSELTFDLNYHYMVTKKLDLSAFTSLGVFSVAFEGSKDDFKYKYEATGGIVRFGTKARYYVYKRFGVMGMASLFSGSGTPDKEKRNTIGNAYSTNLTGYAFELGLCFRFF